jgi:hypothetical protein
MHLANFKVTKYRNIWDSGWIDVNKITAFVGQNEAGKSNLFEALYRINPFVPNEGYNIDEDWPVDDWGNKDASALVCEAEFSLTAAETRALYAEAAIPPQPPELSPSGDEQAQVQGGAADVAMAPKAKLYAPTPLTELVLIGSRSYSGVPTFAAPGDHGEKLDPAKVDAWAKRHAPKFVYIHDYELTGAQIELDQLAARYQQHQWHELSNEEQTIKVILDLARVDIDEFLSKGGTPEGRTVRSFDKRAASSYPASSSATCGHRRRSTFTSRLTVRP